MTEYRGLLQDWHANRGRTGIQVALVLFRLAHVAQRWPSVPRRAATTIYRVWALYGVGIDLPPQVSVGRGLAIHHGNALVVHGGTRIGRGVTLRQSTTLGERISGGGAPRLEDAVDVGAHALVLGPVLLGTGCRIAAGAVILADVPSGATAITKVRTDTRGGGR